MARTLHGIFFTNTGIIPPHVISNLKRIAADAIGTAFVVNFWTDVSLLTETTQVELTAADIMIRDYREALGPLNDVIKDFVIKGHMGDICAYAIASDILRVAIISLISDDDLYVYADCNDIEFLTLPSDLEKLAADFDKNPFGLSFPVGIWEQTPTNKIAVFRNDCMIVRKSNNPAFIGRFLENYSAAVLSRAPTYVTTRDNRLKKQQADAISCFTSAIPFVVLRTGEVRMAHDKEAAPVEAIDFATYINAERQIARANTWRDITEELEDLLRTLPPPVKSLAQNPFTVERETALPFSIKNSFFAPSCGASSTPRPPIENQLLNVQNYFIEPKTIRLDTGFFSSPYSKNSTQEIFTKLRGPKGM